MDKILKNKNLKGKNFEAILNRWEKTLNFSDENAQGKSDQANKIQGKTGNCCRRNLKILKKVG